MPKCPHCREVAGVSVKFQVWGWAVTHYDENGKKLEIDYDGIGNGRHGVCRCRSCGKVRRDVKMIRSTITPSHVRIVPNSE